MDGMACASLKKVLHTVAMVLEQVIWPIDGYVYCYCKWMSLSDLHDYILVLHSTR
jgi:hypothetical protein